MSYVQIEIADKVLTRSPTISVEARSGGYPGYLASLTDFRSNVRTILYQDNNTLYLTDDKTFFLSTGQNGQWIFTSNPKATPLPVSSLPDAVAYPWRSEWANMKTDSPDRNDLIWPVRTLTEAINYVKNKGLPIGIQMYTKVNRDSEEKAWLWVKFYYPGVGQTGYFPVQNRGEVVSPAIFQMTALSGTEGVGLAYRDKNSGWLNVSCWNEGGACRWITHLSGTYPAISMEFDFDPGQKQYTISSGGQYLNMGGWWWLYYPAEEIERGVEFFNKIPPLDTSGGILGVDPELFARSNSTPIRLYIIRNEISALDRYVLGPWFRFVQDNAAFTEYPQWRYDEILANYTKGSSVCKDNEWEGGDITCYRNRQIPYTAARGIEQCTTLDDFSNDTHCQTWAINNRGQDIDTQLRRLCENTSVGEYDDVCACFRPDNVYIQAIRDQRKDQPQLGEAVVFSARTNNLLPCISGLCTQGSNGSRFSPSVYYGGVRTCNVCIQALSANITAGGDIKGDIYNRQVCFLVSGNNSDKYTWNGLIDKLTEMGAVRVNKDGTTSGTVPYVVINSDGDAIKLSTTTTGGRLALSQTKLLSKIDTKDPQGNVILTRQKWLSNPQEYTKEVLVFFFEEAQGPKVK